MGKSSSKLRILVVMHGAGKGGVEQAIITLCRCLDRERFEPIVVFPSEGYAKDELQKMGIKVLVSPMECFIPPGYLSSKCMEKYYYNRFLFLLNERVRNIVDIIRENDIDMVHSSTLTVAEGALAARISGVPHIWHIHGKYSTNHAFLPIKSVYSFLEGFSTRIVAVSNSVKEFISRYIPQQDKIDVVFNGIDLEMLDSKKNSSYPALYRDYPALKGKKIVALIGSVYKVKGIDVYVDAAINILKKRGDIAFLVIGPINDHDLFNSVKNRIDSSSLSESIIFTGFREDVLSLLNDTDLVVCASITEGLPYAVLESMASSKPVVSTRCGGPEEVVLDGETGYLVNKGDPDALAGAVMSIIDDRKKMLAMGRKAREHAAGNYNAEKYARGFEAIYAEVAKASSGMTDGHVDLMVDSLSSLGGLGKRVSDLEHEVEDIKSFIAYFKNNALYSVVKKIFKREKN